MELARFANALFSINEDPNKRAFTELYLAYQAFQQKHNLSFDQISKVINLLTKGEFTANNGKKYFEQAMHVGDYYLFFSRFQTSFFNVFLVLSTIGVIGNSLVIVYFFYLHKKNFRKMGSYHFLITVLAVLDIICCISTTAAYYFDWQIEWSGNETLCLVTFPLAVFAFPNISFWVVGLLAYERYRNIVHPFAKKLGIKVYCILLMLITLLSSSCYYFGSLVERRDFHRHNTAKYCQFNIRKLIYTNFHIGSSSIAILATSPFFINLFFVVKISSYIKTNSMTLPPESKSNRNNDNRQNDSSNIGNFINKRNRSALRTLVLLMLIYILSVAPGRIFMYRYGNYFLFEQESLNFDTKHYALLWISIVARILFLTNNVVNFLVYAYMMKGFRKFLISIVTLGILKKLRK